MADQLLTNTIFLCYCALAYTACCVALAYGAYIILSQFGLWQIRTLHNQLRVLAQWVAVAFVRASFARSIFHVLFAGTKEQVIGSYARRIVAGMAHIQSFRDWSIVEFPRKPMCQNGSAGVASNANVSVLLFDTGASPEPTAFCFLDFLPKAVGEWAASIHAVSGRMGLHINLQLMCHASGGCNRAGASYTLNYTRKSVLVQAF